MISQEKIRRRVRWLQRRIEGVQDRRAFFAHPDLCLWIQSTFQLGWRRLVKRGETRGILGVRLGWIVATVRW